MIHHEDKLLRIVNFFPTHFEKGTDRLKIEVIHLTQIDLRVDNFSGNNRFFPGCFG